MINCEIELDDLSLSKHCIIFEICSTPKLSTNQASNPFTDTLTNSTLFANCDPFMKLIKKINRTTIDDTEGLDLVISMYNLLEYIQNYCDIAGTLLFYSKVEAIDFNNHIEKTGEFKSYKHYS